MCDNLIYAQKLLAKLQHEDNNLVDKVPHGILEQSRRGLTDGLRDFVRVDNHEAVQIGDLFGHADGRSWLNDPGAVSCEGSDDLTSQPDNVRAQRLFINTASIPELQWAQTLYVGVECEDCGCLHEGYVETHKKLHSQGAEPGR